MVMGSEDGESRGRGEERTGWNEEWEMGWWVVKGVMGRVERGEDVVEVR